MGKPVSHGWSPGPHTSGNRHRRGAFAELAGDGARRTGDGGMTRGPTTLMRPSISKPTRMIGRGQPQPQLVSHPVITGGCFLQSSEQYLLPAYPVNLVPHTTQT
jgi:hypothetical protein